MLHNMGSDVGWNVAAMMGGNGACPVVAIVLILPTSLHGLFVAAVEESKAMDMGFHNRITESEHPTANKDPDAFQHTFLA